MQRVMKNFSSVLCGGMLLFFIIAITGCGGGGRPSNTLSAVVSSQSTAKYVGSDTCSRCHQSIYNDFKQSGHPYKLRTRADAEKALEMGLFDIKTPGAAKFATASNYVYTRGDEGQKSVNWNDITYVIGGYKWKARFLDKDGYIVTGSDVQYNLRSGQWSAYNAGKKKLYASCNNCHNTGYNLKGTSKLVGMIGTFELTGVQCENCHGAGSNHVNYRDAMTINREKSLCTKCHNRNWQENANKTIVTAWEEDPEKAVKDYPDAVNTIQAAAPFIKHGEQSEELAASPHSELNCISCHDPHKKGPESIRANCEGCHISKAATYAKSDHYRAGVQCKECHMGKAGMSATATAADKTNYNGDLWTHIFLPKIEDDPTVNSAANGTLLVGNLYEATDFIKSATAPVTLNAKKKAYISWEYSCKRCHTKATAQNFVDLMNAAKGNIHDLNVTSKTTNAALTDAIWNVWNPPQF